MEIDVTQEHIDNGKRKDPSFCPVALACKEQIDHVAHIEAYPSKISMVGLTKKYYKHDATDFMVSFDRGEKVRPRTVNLREVSVFEAYSMKYGGMPV